ncbi:MAG: hypothetical protein Q9227_005830 [Pyrenula ochraceoflavens]
MAANEATVLATEYEIIIVGGGTAGCVIASRLSEDHNVSILLLEAGEDRNKDERVYTPGLRDQILHNPEFDWQYISVAQPGINGRVMKHPRGKMLGGSSAINSFALIYPSAAGLDAWAELGNEGWDWNGTKDYYRKFQTEIDPGQELVQNEASCATANGAPAASGPIHAILPLKRSNLHRAWVETFSAFGLENKNDPRDGTALGGYVSTNHITHDTHERSHAGIAYLGQARDRPNLHLETGTLVQRILFDTSTDGDVVATGVEYIRNNARYRATAQREVILAAGAFASPQLLELSGIGDPTVLSQHGIQTVYSNPNIGENLQDHIRPGLSFEATDAVERRDLLSAEESRRMYEKDRSGPWAESGCFTFAYMPLDPFLTSVEKKQLSSIFDKYLTTPNLSEFDQKRNAFIREMIFSPTEGTATAFLSRGASTDDPENRNWVTLFAMLSHPFSRGNTHITSSDAQVKPRIDFKYYTHPLDLEVHARHIQILDRLSQTDPLRQYIRRDGGRLPPSLDPASFEDAKEIIRNYSMTNYHPCGTCSMMPENIGGVVDSKLRVYGTNNLRVVDASIMPIIPRGNIITTVYAVAEKAADIITAELGLHRTR